MTHKEMLFRKFESQVINSLPKIKDMYRATWHIHMTKFERNGFFW